ncbi:MAG: hypothetical protein VB083_01295 [Aminobacterium sp.]|nr:hypothetical protein [Aminobacterium sp.]MEA4876526.1 hypothetical protein [Aminobacterium sp.]
MTNTDYLEYIFNLLNADEYSIRGWEGQTDAKDILGGYTEILKWGEENRQNCIIIPHSSIFRYFYAYFATKKDFQNMQEQTLGGYHPTLYGVYASPDTHFSPLFVQKIANPEGEGEYSPAGDYYFSVMRCGREPGNEEKAYLAARHDISSNFGVPPALFSLKNDEEWGFFLPGSQVFSDFFLGEGKSKKIEKYYAAKKEEGNICMHCHAIYQDFCCTFPPDTRGFFEKSEVEKGEEKSGVATVSDLSDDIEKIIESIYFLYLENSLPLARADEKIIKILILAGKTIVKIKDILIKLSPNIKKMDMSAQKNDEYINFKIIKVAKEMEKEELEKEIQKISGLEIPGEKEDEDEEIELIY